MDNNGMENKTKGISLRRLHRWLIVAAVVLSCLMVWSTIRLSQSFRTLSQATDEYIFLEKAAYDLMDASDYLTEKVQRFTIDGDLTYMDEYFTEAFETQRREEAVAKMGSDSDAGEAYRLLQAALDASVRLMDREYYAMMLVVEAKGYTGYPDALSETVLTPEDASLSPEEKMKRATETVLGEEYYQLKDVIRGNMRQSLAELERLTRETEASSNRSMSTELFIFRAIIVIQMLGVVGVIWVASRLSISPVLKAVEKIRDESPIPETGAREFRYLAQTYNRMFAVHRNSLRRLSYNASHDALTKVYNRAGYDLIMSDIDISTTYMLLFDVDNFKEYNDTYGHETGDAVLVKVAETLKNHFRSDDHVCRIGGDEFVVLMLNADKVRRNLLELNFMRISEELKNGPDGLPPIFVSAGVAHGSGSISAGDLFVQADKALYSSKDNGKKRCTFFEDM